MSLVEGLDEVLTADAVLVLAEPQHALRPAEAKALQLFVELGGSLLAMASTGKADNGLHTWFPAITKTAGLAGLHHECDGNQPS